MPLTDTAVRHAKPSSKDYSLADGLGLSLFVPIRGSKQWHFRYSLHGKQLRISFGTYPEISLKQARERRDSARAAVAQDIDPRQKRRLERQQRASARDNSFEAVAARWHEFRSKKLTPGQKGGSGQSKRYLDRDILPVLGKLSMAEITRLDVLGVVRRIEGRGALVSAGKCRTWLNHIFRYAMAEGMIDVNPASDLDIVAEAPPPVRHNPHLQLSELPRFLKRLADYNGATTTKLGVRLLLLTGVRTGELRAATPEQFDLESGVWFIPAEGIKQLRNRVRNKGEVIPAYIVPLSRQALEIVSYLLKGKGRGRRYLLPHRVEPHEKISENTLNSAIRRMGFVGELTGHGLRGTISTALNELNFNSGWIEAQLSHADTNKVRAAYNHAQYVVQRRSMMQYWADLLDALEHGASMPEKPVYEGAVLQVSVSNFGSEMELKGLSNNERFRHQNFNQLDER